MVAEVVEEQREAFPLEGPYGPDGSRRRPAAIYLRESERDQGVYSFETQYQQAAEILHRFGFYVRMVEQDSKSGSKVSRRGYLSIAAAVRQGLVEAVGVYMMSRWGRRAAERLRIGQEFDRLGVKIFDASRGGPDEPGVIRAALAGMDEQYLRDLSKKALDNMPKVACRGIHAAPTPLGYMRVYPEGEIDKHKTAVMVEHPIYADVVRSIFRNYAAGWSTAQIARWLNSRPDCPNPHPRSHGRWDRTGIARLLHRKVYIGEIEWGKKKCGD
jgi:DNA invertase Pin-like site-specific DNA recombinase